MSINVSDIVPVIIVFQSILFAMVLLMDDGPKKTSNRCLAAFLLVLAIQFAAIVSERFGFYSEYIHSSLCLYGFAYGPLLFLYTKTLMYQPFDFRAGQLLHFVPAFFILVFSIFGFALCGIVGPLIYISLLVYIVLAVRSMAGYRKIVKNTQSTMAKTDLLWLQWTMILFSITLLLDIVDQFLWNMDIVAGISAIHLTILLLVNWMFYKGLRQPQIFLGISPMDQQFGQGGEAEAKHREPTLEEQADLDRIRELMNREAVYTRPELTLNELAGMLNMPARRLSWLINNFLDQSFMNFVNEYRIDRAKYRLGHPRDKGETILEVMYEVGFNSKSSFNTLFKQQTGFTPSAFRKKQLKS